MIKGDKVRSCYHFISSSANHNAKKEKWGGKMSAPETKRGMGEGRKETGDTGGKKRALVNGGIHRMTVSQS